MPQLFESTQYQERFGDAFLEAIAARAGVTTAKPCPDMIKVDWNFQKNLPLEAGRLRRDAQINVQAKTYIYTNVLGVADFPYKVDRETYNWLSERRIANPRYLVVITLPNEPSELLRQEEDHLFLRQAPFYHEIADGLELPAGQESKTLRIAKSKILTPESLLELLDKSTRRIY